MKFLKKSELINLVGLSYSTIWRLIRANQFPAAIQLSDRRVGWDEEKVYEWMSTRPGSGTRPACLKNEGG